MSDMFIGELRLMSFNYPPKGWAVCNGQLLPISQNQALYSLFGTTYGGDGQVNFGLPDLRGRVALGFVAGYDIGQRGGEAQHTLITAELPAHTHPTRGTSSVANGSSPSNTSALAQTRQAFLYTPLSNPQLMAKDTIGPIGGSQPHENQQPYLTLNYCVALVGIFPSRN
jgi:microcystin-dependent protein